MQRVHIAAAGHGSRMREAMDRMGLGQEIPKHLLPTGEPDGITLLGKIVSQVVEPPFEGRPVVYANPTNIAAIARNPFIRQAAEIVFDPVEGNSLHAYTDALLEGEQRVLGCAGDFYAKFSWLDILAHHESNPFPITFVAGKTPKAEKGAVFTIADNNKIVACNRPSELSPDDLINVGIYIFDSTTAVLDAIHKAASKKEGIEDYFVQTLIAKGLVGAHILDSPVFNVNTPDAYEELLKYTATSAKQQTA